MPNRRLHQCFIDFKDCSVTFPCPSLKVSSIHLHIQARKLHQHFLIFKLKGFIDASSYSSSKPSSTLPHILVQKLCLPQVKKKVIVAFSSTSSNASSMKMRLRLLSKMSMHREDLHLQYVAAENLQYVGVDRTFISNMLQPRSRHLKYATYISASNSPNDDGAILEDDDGATLLLHLQDDNGGVTSPPSLQDEDDGAALPPPLQKDNGAAPRRLRWGSSTSAASIR
ncbi:hypothetical protein E5676_scaffold120G00410 [Cucumis melo var. makuwa]|uniref:Uncharacterized protein n=1 Tax=Cucumis melo var. makuwa TaxID=1194695 RepID=A0A5D3DZB0_CUCMM|nr:hypothetical protein E6C27_scaffold62G00990 [Cucumis melo var. makuwa]TYK28952.1 hypothetical protein E5676_scaffold120G00410 [Cucumis melo var. makuwa]